MRINTKTILFQIGLGALVLFSACGQENGQNNTKVPAVTKAPAVLIWTPAPTPTTYPEDTEESSDTIQISTSDTESENTKSPVETVKPTQTVKPTATVKPTTTPKPTATKKPTPTVKPTPTIKPKATAKPTATVKPTPTKAPNNSSGSIKGSTVTLDDFKAGDFFKSSLFCGDSVMSHFYWATTSKDPENFAGSTFLAVPNYALRHALNEKSDLHPLYKGECKPIWENMKIIKPTRIFLFFGLNDIGAVGVDRFMEDYPVLLKKIKETDPEVKVYILSITPMRADFEKKSLNNALIDKANDRIQVFCKENGLGYIDVATMLKDKNGALDSKYSDGKTNVHFQWGTYELWKKVLVQYAKEQLMAEALEAADQ